MVRARAQQHVQGGRIIDGSGSGDGATAAVLGSGRRRRRGGVGHPGVPYHGEGPAGGPDDLGRREADEAGAPGVGQGRGVHGGQQQQHLLLLLVLAVAVHETQGMKVSDSESGQGFLWFSL